MNFNKDQQQAIDFKDGACAVIAGAGSGKSTVLINRIKNLIDMYDIDENDILAISFTRNTADELKNKLNNMGYSKVNTGTFHSICGKILVKEGITISKDKMIKDWQIQKSFKDLTKQNDIDDVKNFISYQKNYLRDYKDEFMFKESKFSENELRSYYQQYESYKKSNGLFDFDDYLIMCYKILKMNKGKYTFRYVLVDEHQDSNLVQNLLLKEWCSNDNNIFAVFDYRQSLYKFRGGNPEYCMNFNKEWNNSTIINLDTNYRSCKNIVNNANNFIKKYYGQYEYYADGLSDNQNDGNIETLSYNDKYDEAKQIVDIIEDKIKCGISLNKIAILYRLNSHADYIESELKLRGIDYEISKESSFFKRKEIDFILCILRLLLNPHDDGAMQRLFTLRIYPFTFFKNEFFEKVNKQSGDYNISLFEAIDKVKCEKPWQKNNINIFINTINNLRLQCDKNIELLNLIENIKKSFKLDEFINTNFSDKDEIDDRLNSIEVLKTFIKGNSLQNFLNYVVFNTNNKNRKSKESVKLMTIHKSKGLEFDNVFVIGIEDGKFPHEKSDLIEEARVFYVGVTRAKENLYLSQLYDGNTFVEEYIS